MRDPAFEDAIIRSSPGICLSVCLPAWLPATLSACLYSYRHTTSSILKESLSFVSFLHIFQNRDISDEFYRPVTFLATVPQSTECTVS